MAKWMVYQKKEDFRAIAQACGISQVLARLIRNRDVIGIEASYRTWTKQSVFCVKKSVPAYLSV